MQRLAIFLLLAGGSGAFAADVAPETVAAWDDYVGSVQSRLALRVEGKRSFLWMDEEPGRAALVRDGEIVVTHPGSELQSVPHGLIHDWIGAIFIPGATMQDVLAVARDYDHYGDFYKPVVVGSKLLGQNGEQNRFEMLWLQKALFITAAIDAEYESNFVQLDAKRWYIVASSTRIREIQNYGQPDERKLAPDTGCGCLRRVFSVTKLVERDGGVFVEMEAVGLSRDIPASVRFMVSPVVKRLSKGGLLTSLRQTRDAVSSSCERVTASRRVPVTPSPVLSNERPTALRLGFQGPQ
jgi:hypothetical protein